MIRKSAFIAVAIIVLMMTASCSQSRPALVVEIPPGFNGDFVLEMGVKDAGPLEKRGDQYVVTVPRNGSAATSSLLANPRITFENSSDGTVWGYSHSVFTTGDGIAVGGKIEFFVGTKKEFEAEQGKRKHSSEFATPDGLAAGA